MSAAVQKVCEGFGNYAHATGSVCACLMLLIRLLFRLFRVEKKIGKGQNPEKIQISNNDFQSVDNN